MVMQKCDALSDVGVGPAHTSDGVATDRIGGMSGAAVPLTAT